jgi:hypothetical protein
MSSEGDTLASAQERAEAQAKALHHSRLMARLQKEVDAIEDIRLTRKKREASRKRLLAKVGVLGTTLFLAGLAAGSFGNGKISINFLDGNAQSVPQATSGVERRPETPSVANAASSAAVRQGGAVNLDPVGDAERLSVIVGLQPQGVTNATTTAVPVARTFGQGLDLARPPIFPSTGRLPLPSVSPLTNVQPPLPPLPLPGRLPGPTLTVPVIQGNQGSDQTDDGKEAAPAVDVVLRDRSAIAAEPMRSPVPAQVPVPVPVPVKSDSVVATPSIQAFKVMQYLDGYVLVRVGNKVATVRVGERLPDGRLLKAVADGSITTE